MNACIVTFYMDNIDPKTVELQKQVVNKFNKSNVPFYSIKVDCPHGLAIDYFWEMNGERTPHLAGRSIEKKVDHDIILILDIDAIPVHEDAIDYYIERASNGYLIGNAQSSNHLQNNNHVFAAPNVAAISRETFNKLGNPSAMPTPVGDVLEEYTYKAEQVGVPLDIVMPLRFDKAPLRFSWEPHKTPYWVIGDNLHKFGLGTTFGDHRELFWHHYQIFQSDHQLRFWKKCEEVLNG